MFNTDATVRFGQILSARTLRYGKFKYIIIIFTGEREGAPSEAEAGGSERAEQRSRKGA